MVRVSLTQGRVGVGVGVCTAPKSWDLPPSLPVMGDTFLIVHITVIIYIFYML